MRSGGSVLKALSAAEGALPREHRPRAGCAELTRALSTSYRNKLHIGTEKALRYVGEPFLYVLELANLNLNGIAGMRSGGAPSSRRLAHSLIGAPQRGALPREHRPQAGCAELYREHHPRAGHAERGGLRPQGDWPIHLLGRRRGGTPPRVASVSRSCGTVPRAGTGAPLSEY